jgi:hypothetical protein
MLACNVLRCVVLCTCTRSKTHALTHARTLPTPQELTASVETLQAQAKTAHEHGLRLQHELDNVVSKKSQALVRVCCVRAHDLRRTHTHARTQHTPQEQALADLQEDHMELKEDHASIGVCVCVVYVHAI